MQAIGTILYEAEIEEVLNLPYGYTVLQEDTEYKNSKRTLRAQVDEISPNTARYKYYLFEAPPLPKIGLNMPGVNACGGSE